MFSIAAVILFLITFATTKERVQPEVASRSTYQADLRFFLTSIKLHQIMLGGLTLLALLATAFRSETLPWILGGYLLLSMVSFAVRQAALARVADNGSTIDV